MPLRIVLPLIILLVLTDTATILAQLRFKLEIAAGRVSFEELSKIIPALGSIDLRIDAANVPMIRLNFQP